MTQEWFNKQELLPVQDRKDDKDYWKTDNLYTETEVLKLLKYYSQYIQKNKNNIIDDWLEQYGDPQIEQEVKSKLRYQILDNLEEQKENLERQKQEVIEKIRKVRQGNMLEEAAENIGRWYESQGDCFKILSVENNEVCILHSRIWEGFPIFELEALYEHEWRDATPCEGIPERLQKKNR